MRDLPSTARAAFHREPSIRLLLGPVGIHDTPDRMDSVQMTIHDIEAEEQGLLAKRTADATSARRWVWGSFTLAFRSGLSSAGRGL